MMCHLLYFLMCVYFMKRKKKSSSLIIYFLCEDFKCSGILRSMSPSPSVFMIGDFLFIPVRIVSTFVFNFMCLLLFRNCLPTLIKMFKKINTYVTMGCQVSHDDGFGFEISSMGFIYPIKNKRTHFHCSIIQLL